MCGLRARDINHGVELLDDEHSAVLRQNVEHTAKRRAEPQTSDDNPRRRAARDGLRREATERALRFERGARKKDDVAENEIEPPFPLAKSDHPAALPPCTKDPCHQSRVDGMPLRGGTAPRGAGGAGRRTTGFGFRELAGAWGTTLASRDVAGSSGTGEGTRSGVGEASPTSGVGSTGVFGPAARIGSGAGAAGGSTAAFAGGGWLALARFPPAICASINALTVRKRTNTDAQTAARRAVSSRPGSSGAATGGPHGGVVQAPPFDCEPARLCR